MAENSQQATDKKLFHSVRNDGIEPECDRVPWEEARKAARKEWERRQAKYKEEVKQRDEAEEKRREEDLNSKF